MISFDEALALVAEAAKPLDAVTVPLAEAHNRVLAAPVIAGVDSPPRDVSATGYRHDLRFATRLESLLPVESLRREAR